MGTGIYWFKERGQWENRNSTNTSLGWLVFFDWEQDGKFNHVGIVDHVENGMIYTVDGNSTDDGVREKIYISNKVIFDYGISI